MSQVKAEVAEASPFENVEDTLEIKLPKAHKNGKGQTKEELTDQEDTPKNLDATQMYLGEIGNKSFTFHYEVRVNKLVCTKALSKIVCYNSVEHKTISIPERMKLSFDQLLKHTNEAL